MDPLEVVEWLPKDIHILIPYEYYYAIWQEGIKVANEIKIANQLTLR